MKDWSFVTYLRFGIVFIWLEQYYGQPITNQNIVVLLAIYRLSKIVQLFIAPQVDAAKIEQVDKRLTVSCLWHRKRQHN